MDPNLVNESITNPILYLCKQRLFYLGFGDQRSFKLRGRYLVDGGPRNYIIPNFDSIFGFEVGLGLDNSIFVK